MTLNLYKPNQVITTSDISEIQYGSEGKIYIDTSASKIHYYKNGTFTDMFEQANITGLSTDLTNITNDIQLLNDYVRLDQVPIGPITINNNLQTELTGIVQQEANDINNITSKYGASNGICMLDAGGKVAFTNLPSSLLINEGNYNITTNTPTLVDADVYVAGSCFICTVAGTRNFGSGNITVSINDWLIKNNSGIWQMVINSNFINSVFGRTGTISAQSGDYSAFYGSLTDVSNHTTLLNGLSNSSNVTFGSVLGSNYIKSNTTTADTKISGGGTYISWNDLNTVTITGNHGATCFNNQNNNYSNGGFLFRSFNSSNTLIAEPFYIGQSGGTTLLGQYYNFENNQNGIIALKSRNTSQYGGTSKTVAWYMAGKDTNGTDKDVSIILAEPEDGNWVSSNLRFYIRNNDAMENNLQVRPNGCTIWRGLTLTNGYMSINSDASSNNFQGLSINNTYSGTNGYKNCLIKATATYGAQNKDIGGLLWQADNDNTLANTCIYFGNIRADSYSYNMKLNASGNLHIGGNNTNDMGLGTITVEGGVYLGGTVYNNPDYVFEKYYTGDIVKFIDNKGAKDYKWLQLEEIEQYTKINFNLPKVPDKKEAFDRMDICLEKIEELYIFMFQQNKKLKYLEKENIKLQTSIESLQNLSIMQDVSMHSIQEENKKIIETNIELSNSVFTLQNLVGILSKRLDLMALSDSDKE